MSCCAIFAKNYPPINFLILRAFGGKCCECCECCEQILHFTKKPLFVFTFSKSLFRPSQSPIFSLSKSSVRPPLHPLPSSQSPLPSSDSRSRSPQSPVPVLLKAPFPSSSESRSRPLPSYQSPLKVLSPPPPPRIIEKQRNDTKPSRRSWWCVPKWNMTFILLVNGDADFRRLFVLPLHFGK